MVVLKDVERNGYTFTDGCGLVAEWKVKEVA